ncbi:hypothetical protein [Apilactobacillus xinyiensis]|uniref:hypothetical protein n=1 Tax=Apilactobacillus xinyiensis TaxID=2841032 RepID=UPI001C7CD21D|nr:hypothetical protein [Apilactobacillus xinyiensis]
MRNKYLISFLIVFSIMLTFVGLEENASAKYVNNHTTLTELRGAWYNYAGKNKWSKIVVNKHSVNLYMYFENTLHAYSYSLKNNNLNITNLNGKKNVYSFYTGTSHATSSSEYWLSRQRIHGKRVMKSYYNSGYFEVWNRNKIKHNYSYNYDKPDYISQIGK